MSIVCNRWLAHAVAVILAVWVTGCASQAHNQRSEADSTMPVTEVPALQMGEEIALRALALVGKPYRYGGADLDGFDCSGMVYFVHEALGIAVPRTAAEQERAAVTIAKAALRPGDLVFFRTTRSQRVSHVGIYVGENRFVHAPQTGKPIELRALDDGYYGPRLVGSGRFYPGS